MNIKVVRGNPTAEELAAALAVVHARAATAQQPSGAMGASAAWSDPARIATTRVPTPGPASWPRTYWPS